MTPPDLKNFHLECGMFGQASTTLAWLCSRLMSFLSPSPTRNTWKRKPEKLQFESFLIAEKTMEIFAFKDRRHFRFFAEESRDPKLVYSLRE